MPLIAGGVPSRAAIQTAIDEAKTAVTTAYTTAIANLRKRTAVGTATASLASAAQGTIVVAFPAGQFSAPPFVQVTNVGGTGSYTQCYVRAASISATGFTAVAMQRAGTTVTAEVIIHWEATAA